MSRVETLQQLANLPAPSKRDEAWKYTSPQAFLDAAWGEPRAAEVEIDLSKVPFFNSPSVATFVFIDGKLQVKASKNLEKVSYSALVRSTTQSGTEDFFERVNSALLNDGVRLEIKDASAELPIYFLFVSTQASSEAAYNYRLQLKLLLGTQAKIVECHYSESDLTSCSQVVSQIDVQPNANLVYVKVQVGAQSQHLSSTQFKIARDGRVESTQIALGGSLVRQNLRVQFSNEGGEAIVNGLYLGCGEEHIENRTLIDHAVGNTTSAQLYKGILDDKARGVFTGGVKIRKDAQKSNSSQLNNNLMLSKTAEIDTKPELEIEADDVKAAHGATIGQINPDHVFYLQSRALSKAQAVQMLAYGFAQDIVDRVSIESVREELSQLVQHKFSQFHVESL